MDPSLVGLASLLLMFIAIQIGMHIAVVLLTLSFAATWIIRGDINIAGKLLAKAAETSIQSYSFGVIPLFVLMGLLVSASGVGRDTFDVFGRAFKRLSGGLGIATVAANAIFAAINGSTIASASVFTKVAVPELIHHGYTKRFSVGVVAGSSVLGMLIPPSLLLIFYGIIAEVSIGDLFTAGIVPGILLSAVFMLTIISMVKLRPGMVMTREFFAEADDETSLSFSYVFTRLFPIVVLITIVLGGIYGGVFTPVEAGGVGALAALVIALLKRSLTWKSFGELLIETGHVTASIAILIVAAHMYASMLTLSGIPNILSGWIASVDVGFVELLLIYLLVVILLGTILDSISIILIALPLVQPVMMGLGVDMVWFGIVTILAVEIGLLTPPLGLAVFVIKANLGELDININDIFIGAFPFVLAMLLVLALTIVFPALVMFLV